jgi:hypothetical protein
MEGQVTAQKQQARKRPASLEFFATNTGLLHPSLMPDDFVTKLGNTKKS